MVWYLYSNSLISGTLLRQPSIIYVQTTPQGTNYHVQYVQDANTAPQLGVGTTASAVFGDHSDYHVATQAIVPQQQQF